MQTYLSGRRFWIMSTSVGVADLRLTPLCQKDFTFQEDVI